MTVFTVGHSTHTAEAFLKLLREAAVGVLMDVRRFPGSRRHPQFGRAALYELLRGAGIGYIHEPDLGGRRSALPDSTNTGLTVAGFRGYADYMQTDSFRAALAGLMEVAKRTPTVIMCAEAVPWRCHRQFIADQLVARRIEVRHIIGPGQSTLHSLHPAARVTSNGGVCYPGAQPGLFGDEEP